MLNKQYRHYWHEAMPTGRSVETDYSALSGAPVKKITFFTNGRSETPHDFFMEVGTRSMQGINSLYQ